MSSTNSSLREVFLADAKDAEKLVDQVVATYRSYSELVSKLHPFLHRNIDDETFSFNPWWTLDNVKNHGMNEIMFAGLASSVSEYVRKNKGFKRLPVASAKTHRSFQVSDKLFRIQKIDNSEYFSLFPKKNRGHVRSVHKIVIESLNVHFYAENLLHDKYHHLIVRPKYVRGNVELDRWEVILYPQKSDYMIEYID